MTILPSNALRPTHETHTAGRGRSADLLAPSVPDCAINKHVEPVSANIEDAAMNWRLAYTIGFHPWEDTDLPFARKISELFDREEKGRPRSYGLALDLGTGSGIWGIELAKRGWEVTGIDIVDKALRRARERAQKSGVNMRFVRGRCDGTTGGRRRVRLPAGARHWDLPRPEQRPARRDRSGDQRGRRARCHRATARVAAAQETADTRCEP